MHELNRGQLAQFITNLSQHLARSFQTHGHDVRLIAPKLIKPYLTAQKNDFNDAQATAEAVKLRRSVMAPCSPKGASLPRGSVRCRDGTGSTRRTLQRNQ